MNEISIRNTLPTEVEQLRNISQKTFIETFAASNSDENMQLYLDQCLSIAKLTEELQDQNAAFYFAEDSHEIIGYLKLNFGISQTELKDTNAVEIERIYVKQDFLGKKVGQLLYNKAIEVATKRKADYVWLGVWEENKRAIRFYEKNGFVVFDKHIFQLGDDKQTDLMMKLRLK